MFFRLDVLTLFSLVAAATANLHHQAHPLAKRTDAITAVTTAPNTTATLNVGQVSSFLNGWLSNNRPTEQYTVPSQTIAISIPSSLRIAIMTAVPATVLIELMNPTARASVASDFAEGHTPSWYLALPTDIQSFFKQIAGEISTGGGIYTVTPTPTATADPDNGAGAAAETSTSSAEGARATALDRGVFAGAVGLVGILGVALAL